MTKDFSTALQTTLSGNPTVVTAWVITRRDGNIVRLTDNAQDLVIDGDTYLASPGYNRTAIQILSGVEDDNMDLETVFDDAVISRADIEAGLYELARLDIFIVNFNDTTEIALLKSGLLGNVTSLPSGAVRMQLRSLITRMQQRVVPRTSPTCRAELGDRLCKVPLFPDLVERSVSYDVGEFVTVQTGTSTPTTVSGFLVSGDLDSLTGWTTETGTPSIVASLGSLTPQEGTGFLTGGSEEFSVSQTVDLTIQVNWSASNVDALQSVLNFSVYQGQGNLDALGRVRVCALDANGSVIREMFNSRYGRTLDNNFRAVEDTWQLVRGGGITLPAGTRQLRFYLEGARGPTGGNSQAAFDNLRAEVINTGVTGAQALYENRIYECTTAGTSAGSSPTFNTTVGATTTDGTAVFTARDAFVRHSTVTSVTDRRQFTVSTVDINDSRAIDDWFNVGALVFESGNNIYQTQEIKDWGSSGATVLYLPVPFDITVGDVVYLVPGCDKQRTTCKNKFAIALSTLFPSGNVVNFRGEPDLPGEDAVLAYPDAI